MKTIVVIGGSSGIGKSLIDLLKNDYKIISMQRRTLDRVGVNLKSFELDVLNDELPELDVVDKLVYCPGSINLKPFNRLSLDDFRKDFDINVIGAIRVLNKYLPILKNSKDASVLLFSTVAVKLGMPFHSSVATAKGAVEGLIKSLAAEYAPSVRFNAIAPTLTDTPLASKILRNDKSKELSANRHPLNRYLVPSEVAHMAEFLISDKSRSMTGKVIEMDCGIVSLKV